MLILNTEDIYKSIEPIEIIEAVERAFIIQKSQDFKMPDRMHIGKDGNTHLVMPCLAENLFSTKLVSVNPKNKNKGLPIISGVVQLADHNNGKVLAIFNGGTVTALRTGAVGAVAVKYLTNSNVNNIGLIGTGVQGLHLLLMINAIRDLNQITIFNHKTSQSNWFKEELIKKIPGTKINFTDSKKDLLNSSQIILTATTSPTPVLPEDTELLKGKTYICVGSFKPIMGELPRSIYSILDKIYVDVEYATRESGDVAYPLEKGILNHDQIIPINELVTGMQSPSGHTKVFKSVGMALFDLTTAEKIYTSALNKGIGTEFVL